MSSSGDEGSQPRALSEVSNVHDLRVYLSVPTVQVRQERLYEVTDALGDGPVGGSVKAENVVGVLLDRVRSDSDLENQHTVLRRLAEACEQVPHAVGVNVWGIETVLNDVDDPSLHRATIDLLVEVARDGPPGARRAVVRTLVRVFEMEQERGQFADFVLEAIGEAFTRLAESEVPELDGVPFQQLFRCKHAPRGDLLAAMVMNAASSQRVWPVSKNSGQSVATTVGLSWYLLTIEFSESERKTFFERMQEVEVAT